MSDFCIENGTLKKYKGNDELVIIPDDVIVIESNAFESCTNMVSAILKKNVTLIGDNAFKDCINLLAVLVPSRVKNFDRNTIFSGCTNLESVIFTNPEYEKTYSATKKTLLLKHLKQITRFIGGQIPLGYVIKLIEEYNLPTNRYDAIKEKCNEMRKRIIDGEQSVSCSDKAIHEGYSVDISYKEERAYATKIAERLKTVRKNIIAGGEIYRIYDFCIDEMAERIMNRSEAEEIKYMADNLVVESNDENIFDILNNLSDEKNRRYNSWLLCLYRVKYPHPTRNKKVRDFLDD